MDRALRGCPVPGCDQLITADCPVHPPTTGASSGAYDEDWGKLARRHLEESPRCVRCGGPASEVDHVVPVRMGGRRLDRDNLRSLCHPCHSQITAATRSRAAPVRRYNRRYR